LETITELNNKPLVEVLFEVRWGWMDHLAWL